MVAVALNHILQEPDMLGVGAHKPVFVNGHNALAVADVEQSGTHRIVRRAISVAAKVLKPLNPVLHEGLRYC